MGETPPRRCRKCGCTWIGIRVLGQPNSRCYRCWLEGMRRVLARATRRKER